MKITIAGLPGSGKGTLREKLATKYSYDSFSMGDIKGKFAENLGLTIDEFMAQCPPEEVHHKVDNYQTELGQKQDNFVVDGWMSWNFIPDSIKIFLEVDWDNAAQRIFNAERGKDEPKYSNTEQCKEIIQQRYWETRRQTMQEYDDADFDDRENYDIIINTSDKDPEKVYTLAERKIRDYKQLMNPPRFYLAHPSKSKQSVRKWELEFEKRTGIELINPFFDCNTKETEMGHLEEEKYEILGSESSQLARGDLEGLADRTTIGGIFVVDDSFTIGTPAEMATTKLMGKLVYTLVTHPEAVYQKHPFVMLFSDQIFTTKNSLTHYLNKNKSRLFRYLEQSRQKTLNDSTFQAMYEQIYKNIKNKTT